MNHIPARVDSSEPGLPWHSWVLLGGPPTGTGESAKRRDIGPGKRNCRNVLGPASWSWPRKGLQMPPNTDPSWGHDDEALNVGRRARRDPAAETRSGSSTPRRGNQGRNGKGRGRHLHPGGGPDQDQGACRRHFSCRADATAARIARACCAQFWHLISSASPWMCRGMGVWVWYCGSGWRGPGGYYRCAARPPLFIQCFWSFSPLCLSLLSPVCCLVSVVLSFIRSFSQPGMLATI